jgi:hypothetical protein
MDLIEGTFNLVVMCIMMVFVLTLRFCCVWFGLYVYYLFVLY